MVASARTGVRERVAAAAMSRQTQMRHEISYWDFFLNVLNLSYGTVERNRFVFLISFLLRG